MIPKPKLLHVHNHSGASTLTILKNCFIMSVTIGVDFIKDIHHLEGGVCKHIHYTPQHIHTALLSHTYIYTYTHIHTSMSTYNLHTYTRPHTHVITPTLTYTHPHIHLHTHTHNIHIQLTHPCPYTHLHTINLHAVERRSTRPTILVWRTPGFYGCRPFPFRLGCGPRHCPSVGVPTLPRSRHYL